MDNLPPVILASASPRRSELLTSMDIEFEVVPSHVEELLDGYDFIPDLCEANARIKAEPIAELHPECLVLAADTMVYLEDIVYGKPTHCRKWEFTDRLLTIEDKVSGKGSHKIDLVFPLHPDIEIKAINEDDVILGLSGKQIKVKFKGQGSMYVEKSAYYPKFGLSVENSQIHFRLSGELPIEVITRISW